MSKRRPRSVTPRRARREAAALRRAEASGGDAAATTREFAAGAGARPYRVIGWFEALLITCLVVLSLALLAGGAWLVRNGVPPSDHYGTLAGLIEPTSASSGLPTAFTSGSHAAVVATAVGDSRRVATAPVAANGAFSLRLLPGDYILRLDAPGAATATAARVRVLGGEVLRPHLHLNAPARAAGAAPRG
jgi:hypothetical protein